jgi:hypothetical protein
MKEIISAGIVCLCFIVLCGTFIWQSVQLRAERQRADAAEAEVEKINHGRDFLEVVVKQVVEGLKENCANELAVCKQEAVPECSK